MADNPGPSLHVARATREQVCERTLTLLARASAVKSADNYRQHAEKCLKVAVRLSDADDKGRLVQIARSLLDLANALERKFPSKQD